MNVNEDIKLAFARLGEWDTSTDIDIDFSSVTGKVQSDEHVDVAIEKSIVHPEYNVAAKKNDIALLRLIRNVKFSQFILPICLPTNPSVRNVSLVGLPLTVAGLSS